MIIFFTFPETKGKTEVELAALFEDPKSDHENPIILEGLEAEINNLPESEKGGVVITKDKAFSGN